MGAKRVAIVVVAFVALAACADVLGIDDGTPRSYDGSADATTSDASDAGDAHADVVGDVVVDVFSPLHCGTSTCNHAAGETCCWADAGFVCKGANATCNGVNVTCDRPEQCAQSGDAGAVACCGTYATTDAGTVATAIACLPESQCNTGSTRFILCGDGDAGDCLPDASCIQSSFTLPTFLICK